MLHTFGDHVSRMDNTKKGWDVEYIFIYIESSMVS